MVDREQVEVEPWHAVWSDAGTWPGQPARHDEVRLRGEVTLGDRVFLAEGAAITCESLTVGDRTYVAAGCVLRDRVTLGSDCTLNPYVVMAGRVTIGDDVRIASFAALYGFNHRFDGLDRPIWHQGEDEEGIVVGDDVWIGTHAVVCDGVTVGAHSVVAAGAVVTRDVPPWSVVAGVPARVIADRRDPRPDDGSDPGRVKDGTNDDSEGRPTGRPGDGPTGARRAGPRRDGLTRLDERIAEQWPDVLSRCRLDTDHGVAAYVDHPGGAWRSRPTCDAIEIAAACGDVGGAGPRDDLVAWLHGLQDAATGLFPDPTEPALGDDPLALDLDAEHHQYGVLSVGYALELLGSAPLHPVHAVAALSSDALVARLDALPWSSLAWPAGSWVDFMATATYLDRRHHGSDRSIETLLGWLVTRVDPRTGMWGPPDDTWGWLMPVNGFYRLTRGTHAQFGVPLPHPEAAIDTVAAHARENGWFVERNRSACHVLDVVHPLWLAARQTDHRRAELRDAIAALVDDTTTRWVDGEGFAFAPGKPCGLQGTEMWMAIVHVAADLLGESDGLSWTPRGVHRLAPADTAHRPL